MIKNKYIIIKLLVVQLKMLYELESRDPFIPMSLNAAFYSSSLNFIILFLV